MHDIRLIRDNPEAFDEGLRKRGLAPLTEGLLAIDDRRRAAIARLQAAQETRNALSKQIRKAFASNNEDGAGLLISEVAALKTTISAGEAEEKAAVAEFDKALAEIPNAPLSDVPEGKDEYDNVERSRFGDKRVYALEPKQHFELGEALGLMDFGAAAKLSGARFVVLRGALARLERALGQFMLDVHTSEHGYTEVAPPLLVRDEVMFGTAQLPKFKPDQFPTSRQPFDPRRFTSDAMIPAMNELGITALTIGKQPGQFAVAVEHKLEELIEKDRLWLIPTAEVPLTNLARETILSEEELPKRFTALTPCFRAEAGAAGRDTRGMLRQHQFTKCELVSITTPERSADEHERMLACAEAVLRRLDLHYRVVTLCSGDMGFAAAKTYDIEVWLPGQGAYREISSCSTCTDFQARRMNARYRARDARQPRFVHTLNGSGVAVGRALIAVMETHQNEDGSVTVPSALSPYMGGVDRIEKAV